MDDHPQPTSGTAFYELAERRENGVLVRLLWDSIRNQTVIRYRDRLTGDMFVADVPNSRALVAFHHPHAYRPSAIGGYPIEHFA